MDIIKDDSKNKRAFKANNQRDLLGKCFRGGLTRDPCKSVSLHQCKLCEAHDVYYASLLAIHCKGVRNICDSR